MRFLFIILLFSLAATPLVAQDEGAVEEEPIDERFTIDTPVTLDFDQEEEEEEPKKKKKKKVKKKGLLRDQNKEGIYTQGPGKPRDL